MSKTPQPKERYHLQCQFSFWNSDKPWITLDTAVNAAELAAWCVDLGKDNPNFKFRVVSVKQVK